MENEELKKELEEIDESDISDEELIEIMWSRFRPMNEDEQKGLLKILLLNYYHYVTELKEKRTDILFGACSECDFVISFLIFPPKELLEMGFDPRKFIIKNAAKEFDSIFCKKVDA